MIKLSIITPFYKRHDDIQKLAKVLEPQLNTEVEWIIVDDGDGDKSLVDRKAIVIFLYNQSGGASVPRNAGLDLAKGQYITFIDSDDTVSSNYVSKIFEKIDNEEFDVCYIGWQSKAFRIAMLDGPPKWNCSVWSRVYNRNAIGDIRFDPLLVIGEDFDFDNKVKKDKCIAIHDILYYYNTDSPDSLMKIHSRRQ